ncbi:sigma factor-like helix-turn-helix DNA-binding protein, partial [Escherichia coli]
MTEHDAICISALHQIFSDEEHLSEQQKDIILMYAYGYTLNEIADFKGLKPSTVRKYLDSVRAELGGVSLAGIRTLVLIRTNALLVSSLSRISERGNLGNDSNLLIVFYVQIMPDDLVMQLHR